MLHVLPLNIEGMEVPKYTVRLGKFHMNDLGTLIGARLESWSANTCMKDFHLLLFFMHMIKCTENHHLSIQISAIVDIIFFPFSLPLCLSTGM